MEEELQNFGEHFLFCKIKANDNYILFSSLMVPLSKTANFVVAYGTKYGIKVFPPDHNKFKVKDISKLGL